MNQGEKKNRETLSKIYLLVKDEDGEDLDEVWWCEDRTRDTDVEYVLASELEQALVEIQLLRTELFTLRRRATMTEEGE